MNSGTPARTASLPKVPEDNLSPKSPGNPVVRAYRLSDPLRIGGGTLRPLRAPAFSRLGPDEARDFPGLVMSINKNINMAKRFRLPPNNVLARQLLGKLGRGRWHLLHQRERGADGLGVVAEMFCYLPAADMSRAGIKIGQSVLVSVIPYAPPQMEPVWIVTEVSITG